VPRPFARIVRRAHPLILLALIVVPGCAKTIHAPLPDQRPTVRLTQGPVGTRTPYFYSYEMRWTGYDPDGRIQYFRYCLDAPSFGDTAWVTTTDNRHTFAFTSNDPDSLGTPYAPGGYHTFVIEAVDNGGLRSEPVYRSFTSYTIAPSVHLVQPVPNRLFHPQLPPSVTFRWTGTDPDGQHSLKPVKYKFKLFKDGDHFDIGNIAAFFDSLRNAWPPNFAGWDSSGSGDTTRQVQNLTPQGTYVFAVVAFDEAGAYSPVNSFDTNMLYFYVDYPVVHGPKITMYNESFNYTYLSPGYINDPRRYVNLEIASGRTVTLHWSADPGPFATMKSYRWCMDIDKIDDETPRTSLNDWRHWSDSFLSNTQATVGPFANQDSTHLFFIEAEDNNGLKSLGIVSLAVVSPTFNHDLLFVDDTRFMVDQRVDGSPDSLLPPTGDWPTAAELDTFLFARGGVRWRYYPDGTLSVPGLFAGYAYDTIDTKTLATPTVALSVLADYRHVVWYCDEAAQPGYMPALRWMSMSGRQNTLGAYVTMGGQVWLMGGGGGYNTMVPYNIASNDANGMVLSRSTGELVPGRFMFDLAHWQSEMTDLLGPNSASVSPAAVGGWPGAPDYTLLPPLLQGRTRTSDPLPPFRAPNAFYKGQYEAEYITQPNSIVEDYDPDPEREDLRSTLDTLYTAAGGTGSGRPVMTYYHGLENAPFLFSGFPIWYFRRVQAQALADWVLGTLWGMPKSAPGPVPMWRAARPPTAAGATRARPTTVRRP